MNRHEHLVDAIAELHPHLPALVGESWLDLDVRLTTLLRELEGGRLEAEDEILALVATSPPALDALNDLLATMATGRTRGSAAPVLVARARCVRVPLLFGTDRTPAERTESLPTYGGLRGDRLRLGYAEVSIPDDHRMGRVERPRWWRLEFRPDPTRHVVIGRVGELDPPEFERQAQGLRPDGDETEALVFIHGYNVDFDDALRRAAQIAYDLHFGGLVALFSWPSAGTLTGYLTDENNVRWAQDHFRDFLALLLSRLGLAAVHLMAHSMGNRVLSEVLGASLPVREQESWARLDQIVFAAPDVDRDTFRQLTRRFHALAGRCTLYASSNDLALRHSRRFHGYPRAGDSDQGILIAQGIDAIDASGVDTSLTGHSYYGDNRSVLSDLFSLFREGRDPDQRFGLRRRDVPDGRYWVFQP
jgi:esterase/lipase superfamily enzyme